jgi:3-oxoacyl-[acyl-carrier protein] reductase
MAKKSAGESRSLEGRVALISGVAKTNSIGFATAEVFGEKGARLGIVDISEKVHECAALLRGKGLEVVSATADLTKAAQVRSAVDLIIKDYDRIDILVNNAGMAVYGIDEVFKEVVDLTDEEWDFSIGINLKTQFNCTRAVLPGMIDKGYGKIVNISSVTGQLVANPGEGGYGAAKAGVVGLTRTLALEVAKKGITVNAIAPGWVDTGSTTEEERVAGLNTAMGRPGAPREVAQLAAFLASDESAYITGQVVVIDGGNTIQEYKGPSELYY